MTTAAPASVKTFPWGLVLIVFLVIVGLLAVSVRFDWEERIGRYLQEQTLAPKAQLTVTLSHGQAKVLLDGNEIGKTPVDLNNIPPGKGTLQLMRDPNPNNFYAPLNIPVTLVARSQTVVVADLGPSYDTSSFWVSYVDDRFADNNLYIETIPTGSQITVDKEFRGQSPLSVTSLTEGSHDLSISQEGFQELATTVQIVPNKTVFVSAKLYKAPLKLE